MGSLFWLKHSTTKIYNTASLEVVCFLGGKTEHKALLGYLKSKLPIGSRIDLFVLLSLLRFRVLFNT